MSATSTLAIPTFTTAVRNYDNLTDAEINVYIHWGLVLTAVSGMNGKADGLFRRGHRLACRACGHGKRLADCVAHTLR
jgi:hypothetical protein